MGDSFEIRRRGEYFTHESRKNRNILILNFFNFFFFPLFSVLRPSRGNRLIKKLRLFQNILLVFLGLKNCKFADLRGFYRNVGGPPFANH